MSYHNPLNYLPSFKGSCVGTPYSTHDLYTELQSMRMNKICGTKPQPDCPQAQMPIGFAAFQAACANVVCQPNYVTVTAAVAKPQPQREYTMIDQEMDQRRYIVDRLYGIHRQKDLALEEFFGLRDDNRPNSPEEMIKRIQDGKYVLEAKDEFDDDDESFSYSNFERLHWRDPAKVRDQAGYKAAEKNLKAAVQKLQDKARLYTIADATKAFEEFEATDFTTVH